MAGAGSAKVAPVTGPRIEGTVVSSVDRTRALTAVVYLEDAPKQPGALTTAEVDVKNKDFTPPVAVVTAGGSVTFGNKDALTHHVFSPDVPNWDTGYLQKDGASPAHRFDTPGAFSLLCNIHPEMIGYVLVIPSTAFGRVGPDGKYVIGNVPPGSYRATAWSPHMKPMTQPVTIGPSGATKLSFELQPAGAGTSG
jgi:plastocyanin